MLLAEFMKLNDLSDQEMANLLRCDRTFVTKLRNGQADPSMALARRIARVTKDKVGLADWPEPARAAS
jgi:plasmid maintenance system antidote protein VapI